MSSFSLSWNFTKGFLEEKFEPSILVFIVHFVVCRKSTIVGLGNIFPVIPGDSKDLEILYNCNFDHPN
jgi:hypothetical protein